MDRPEYVTKEMIDTKSGVFVSLKKSGELRGCIGTIFPVTDSISKEIVRNAVAAGISDPRFNNVEKEEIEDITFSVDVLTEPKVASVQELDPKKFGVIVTSGKKSGVLLPDLSGVNTVDQQISIVLDKAGISSNEDYLIEKFQVIRHK